jgi:hypothetical protein
MVSRTDRVALNGYFYVGGGVLGNSQTTYRTQKRDRCRDSETIDQISYQNR